MKSFRPIPLLAAVVSLALLGSSARAGDPSFTYVDLGTLGGPASVAMGLNDSQQVVGWSHVTGCTVDGQPCRRAFLWENGVMTDLGLLSGDEGSIARAINESGLIVGTSERDVVAGFGVYAGFSYESGTMTALADLGTSGSTFAYDVSDAGVIVGSVPDPVTVRDTTAIWLAGAITNVGATEPHSYSRGNGINENGLLVGLAWNLFSPNDATLFDGVKWSTIGGEAGPFQNAEAYDVNNSGVAVGLQAFPSGSWHPTIWTPGIPGGTDLGTLPGHDIGELFDVNDAGWAVGHTWLDIDPGTSRAVLFDGTTLHDLNDFLPEGSSVVLFEAREVNENGDIVGTAVVDGFFRGFMMTLDGPWEDLGLGLAGISGVPELIGTGALEGGDPVTLTLTNAAASATTYFVLGAARIDLPFKGGTLVPAISSPLGTYFVLQTNGAGELTLPGTWPNGLPAGFEFFFQHWVVDAAGPLGFAASNAVQATTP
jgi:probable HAF family extracellular repeat protein